LPRWSIICGVPSGAVLVQYTNELEKPTLPSGRKKPYEFDTGWPCLAP
jgi:hypothetical protein